MQDTNRVTSYSGRRMTDCFDTSERVARGGQLRPSVQRFVRRVAGSVGWRVVICDAADEPVTFWARQPAENTASLILRQPDINTKFSSSKALTFFPFAMPRTAVVLVNARAARTWEKKALIQHELGHVLLRARHFQNAAMTRVENPETVDKLYFAVNLVQDVVLEKLLASEGLKRQRFLRGELSDCIDILACGYSRIAQLGSGQSATRSFVATQAAFFKLVVERCPGKKRRLWGLLPPAVAQEADQYVSAITEKPAATRAQYERLARLAARIAGVSNVVFMN